MSKLFEEIAQGTAEARAYMEGERKGHKMTLSESIDALTQYQSSETNPSCWTHMNRRNLGSGEQRNSQPT
jgi:hypothetical protein